jgi:hypothetical protein
MERFSSEVHKVRVFHSYECLRCASLGSGTAQYTLMSKTFHQMRHLLQRYLSYVVLVPVVVLVVLVLVGGMSQIVPLGSLTQVLVLRLQQVTPGQSLSLVQATPEEVGDAEVLAWYNS